ncbi:hypothetical protein IFM89_003866 [Coptis chinensis]|uniref:Uncharacterized protein n=1 Tax=Coptis chinensis TaxID=261450 RepID=A0A835M257_9MAGN|nr:hypothetical protein IFM89_003866 [Coptis chinensis]
MCSKVGCHKPIVVRETSKLRYVLAATIFLNIIQPVLHGFAIGAGWQFQVAFINDVCYYVIGLPIAALLGDLVRNVSRCQADQYVMYVFILISSKGSSRQAFKPHTSMLCMELAYLNILIIGAYLVFVAHSQPISANSLFVDSQV